MHRQLVFHNYAEIIREVKDLSKGYRIGGQWNLAQISKHLSFYFRGSLDGFKIKLPWLIRVTYGKMLLKKRLAGAPYKAGTPTAPPSVYTPDESEKVAVDEILELLTRLDKNTDAMHPSALFGELTNGQWKILHLHHAAHHLGFLHPE